uniref:Uncharacterized protein n=1 Tax=Ditylenchus dipsaci TaxID=166011 RepID=A0A915DB87_9BILA
MLFLRSPMIAIRFYACGADKEAVMKWAVEMMDKSSNIYALQIPSELSLDNMKYVPLVGQGRNVLGVICMKIRKQILDGLSEQKVITVEMFLPPIMNALSMSSVNVAGEQESEEIDINIPRDAILAQSYDRDTFYACGADKEAVMKWAVENDGQVIKIPSELSLDNMKYVPLVGQGRNVLGVICMKIRKQILDGLSEQKVITVEMFLPPIMNALSMSSVNVAGEQESEEIDINIPRDAILAQSYDRDTFYACGADKEAVMKWAVENDGQVIKIPSELSLDNMKYVPLVGQGRNVLGVICMKIRKQILDGLSEQKVITVEMFLPPIMNALSMSSVNVAGEQESEEIDINIPSLSLS